MAVAVPRVVDDAFERIFVALERGIVEMTTHAPRELRAVERLRSLPRADFGQRAFSVRFVRAHRSRGRWRSCAMRASELDRVPSGDDISLPDLWRVVAHAGRLAAWGTHAW